MGNQTGLPSSCPGKRIANSTISLLLGRVAIFLEYCSIVKVCSIKAPSCTSPQVPRDLTFVKTRFKSPTPVAKVCISPSPRCTCSKRSDTCLNDSPRRCSKVACNFSSTVWRICSSLFEVSI